MAEILIIDDDEMAQQMLVIYLQRLGHRVNCASTLAQGIKHVLAGAYDVILLDVRLPDGNGLEYLSRFKGALSCPEIIIITGKGDEKGAEKAIRNGAWCYIEKPDILRELGLHLTRVLQYRTEKNRVEKIPIALKRDSIIGTSPMLTECLDRVAQAAFSDASVLITGETGTGKELFAKAIHENSKRAEKNFIIVDCAALPENLVESTLFGHVKGAFTGAETRQEGLIRLADGGTLFLDEVGELPLSIQKKFLRVLQEHIFRPVGSTHEEHSDFRIIAATNQNVEKCVEQGKFRNDLLYRLKAFSFSAPPLRNRKEDIKPLTQYIIARICDRSNMQCKGFTPDFIEHLTGYDWPGNIRELKQTMEQVIAYAIQAPTLFATHLPEHFRIRQARAAVKTASADVSAIVPLPKSDSPVPAPVSWQSYKSVCEKNYIIDLMQYADGNVTIACQVSGLSRTRLYQLREKYQLKISS